MSAPEPPTPVNKTALLVVTMAATAVGTLPWVLVFGRPAHLLLFAAWAAVLAYRPLRTFQSFAHRKPSFLEFVAGGIGMLSQPAAGALMALTVGLLLQLVGEAFHILATWAEWSVRPPVRAIAFWSGLVIVLLMLAPSADWSRNLARQLYPQLAGVPSAFFEYVHGRKQKALRLAILLLVVLALVYAVLDIAAPRVARSALFNLLLVFVLINVARPIRELGEGTQPKEYGRAVDAVKRLLEESGYTVVTAPRTGREEIDPLLVNVDLYAESAEASYVVDVKPAGASTPEVLQEASDIATAAWALGRLQSETAGEASSGEIKPLLVLVGEVDRDLLAALSEKASVRVAALGGQEVVERILASEDPDQLREIAARELDVPVAIPPVAVELAAGRQEAGA